MERGTHAESNENNREGTALTCDSGNDHHEPDEKNHRTTGCHIKKWH